MVLVMTIMQPDITKIPAQYRDVLTRNARRVVALQLTGVPENKGAADAAIRPRGCCNFLLRMMTYWVWSITSWRVAPGRLWFG